MMKKFSPVIIALATVLFCINPAYAQYKADTDKMYNLILTALEVVQTLGEESFPAFDDPAGEFTIKDDKGTILMNVGIADCIKGLVVADPEAKGMNIEDLVDQKTGKMILKDICDNISEKGRWMEFYWPDGGDDNKLKRMILFYFAVPNEPYILYIGGFDDNASLEELNSKL